MPRARASATSESPCCPSNSDRRRGGGILWAAAAPGLPGTLQIFARLPAAAGARAGVRAPCALAPPFRRPSLFGSNKRAAGSHNSGSTAPGLFPIVLNPDLSANGEHHAAPPPCWSSMPQATASTTRKAPAAPRTSDRRRGGGILWAAAAPGLPGTLQIFARLPAAAGAGAASATLRAGTAVSPPVTVWIE